MRKRISVILFAAIMSCTVVFAQETGNSFYQQSLIKRLFLELDVSAVPPYKETRLLSVGGKVGLYVTPQLYAFAMCEGVTGLNDANGVRSYAQTSNLGGGLGFRFLTLDKDGKRAKYGTDFSVYAQMAASVGNVDWKQTVYEAGVKLKLMKGISPTFGLGFRHTNSHTVGMPNHNGMVATIGFGL